MNFDDIPNKISPPNYRTWVQWGRDLLSTISRYQELYNLEIDPIFQRERVWTEQQQIAYIQFILQGGSSGRELYCNHPQWGKSYNGTMQLVDGKQRLTTVLDFLNNRIPIFGGYFYKDFSGYIPSNACFYFNINNISNQKDVMRWYIHLNGGVAHTPEELQRVQMLIDKEEK